MNAVTTRPFERTTWIGVSPNKTKDMYKSYIYHPELHKIINIGVFPTAYKAAKARHMYLQSMPYDVAKRISNDFVPDRDDPDFFPHNLNINMAANDNYGAPSTYMGQYPDYYNYYNQHGQTYAYKHMMENMYDDTIRRRLEKHYPIYNTQPLYSQDGRGRRPRRKVTRRKLSRRVKASNRTSK